AGAGGRVQAASGRRAGEARRALAARGRQAWHVLHRNRDPAAGALVLLLGPALVVLAALRTVVLGGLDPQVLAAAGQHVLELLRGERLAPPPELPPAVFTAAEAELQRTGTDAAAPQAIASADRRWERVAPGLRQSVLAIHQAMARQGYRMVLVEGYRS